MQTSVQSASRSSPTTIPIPIPMASPMIVPTRRVFEINYYHAMDKKGRVMGRIWIIPIYSVTVAPWNLRNQRCASLL